MINPDNMNNRAVIEEQYRDTGRLALRKSLHEKYSVNKLGFQKWMFQQYAFRPKCRVLELGSGRGELWNCYFESHRLQGYEMDITVSDFSEGMVEHLRHICEGRNITVQKVDILDIPFEKEAFDLVIANSMLYHVREIRRALSEVRRVLKKDGLFYCSTLGTNGMTGYLYHALDELGISYHHESELSFTLQNGMPLLKEQFEKVERRDYEDALEIDCVEDYIDYIYSMASMQGLDQSNRKTMLSYFNSRKVNGYLHVPKEYGMFVAGRE